MNYYFFYSSKWILDSGRENLISGVAIINIENHSKYLEYLSDGSIISQILNYISSKSSYLNIDNGSLINLNLLGKEFE